MTWQDLGPARDSISKIWTLNIGKFVSGKCKESDLMVYRMEVRQLWDKQE